MASYINVSESPKHFMVLDAVSMGVNEFDYTSSFKDFWLDKGGKLPDHAERKDTPNRDRFLPSKINLSFVICDSCFWCATIIRGYDLKSCPLCHSLNINESVLPQSFQSIGIAGQWGTKL